MDAARNLPSASPSPQEIIESAGATYIGIQESLRGPVHCFNDPITQTTLALYQPDLTEEAVRFIMLESRRLFSAKAGA